jgi:hypothetical protein
VAQSTDALKKAFSTAKEEVNTILLNYPHKEILQSKLYFFDFKGIVQIEAVRLNLEKHYLSDEDREAYSFNHIVKVLDIGPTEYYHTGVRSRRRQLSTAELIKNRLDEEFAIWKNTIRKEAREYASLHSISDEELCEREKELQRRIIEAESNFRYLKSNFDSLEVRISGWDEKHENLYAYITYRCEGVLRNKHLSVRVPSILHFQPTPYRSDMKIAEFIENATNAFGNIYFMHKKENM